MTRDVQLICKEINNYIEYFYSSMYHAQFQIRLNKNKLHLDVDCHKDHFTLTSWSHFNLEMYERLMELLTVSDNSILINFSK